MHQIFFGMEGLDSPVYSRDVIEFVTVANEFCKFLESAESRNLKDLIDKAHRLLPLLYLKGTMLPKVEDSYEEFNEKFVTENDYNYIREMLQVKFGKHDSFDEIYDPLRQENDEPAQLSVGESIADIYQDIKDFIMQYRVGTEEIMFNAIWECKQTFEQYWGQRIVNTLRVLHHLKYVVVELDEENTGESTGDEFDYNSVDTSNWLISKMQEGGENEE